MKKIASLFFLFSLIIFICLSQKLSAQYATRQLGKKQQAYVDSIKNSTWPYKFPLLGAKATKAGFDVQYPFGVMVNFYHQDQNLIIDGLQLGTNNIEMTDINFVKFDNVRGVSNVVNFRPDIWVFPFLNVYGLFAVGKTETHVDFSVTNQAGESVVGPITAEANFDGFGYGFGITGAGGVGPLFFAVDANWVWTNIDELKYPVNANQLGLRLGHIFQNKNHPERNIGLWVTATRQIIDQKTEGAIKIKDVLNVDPAKVQELRDRYSEWYDELGPVQQAVADEIISRMEDHLNGLDVGDAEIRYKLNKEPVDIWNGGIGGQFQYNKHWVFRVEAGFIGDRSNLLLSTNYRFGF